MLEQTSFSAHTSWPGLAVLLFGITASGCGSSDVNDTTPPTLKISDDVSAEVATGDVSFTFQFNEDITPTFNAASVTVDGGTKGLFERISPKRAVMIVRPTPDAVGTISVAVAARAFADLAGNTNTATAGASQDFNTQGNLQPVQMTLPVDFDSDNISYGLLGFGGAEDSSIVVDATDATNMVAQVIRSASAETFAGTTLTDDGSRGFAQRIPIDQNNTRMTVRVWSPDAGTVVRLKVEDAGDNTITAETEAPTTVAGAWQTLTFDFANEAAGTSAIDVRANFNKATVFFNFGTDGATAGEKTYFFDDMVFIGGGGIDPGPGDYETITFDEPGTTYALTGFGGAEDSQVVADPMNGANQVARVVRSAGSLVFAGTTVSTGPNDSIAVVPFEAGSTTMTVRVLSPDAGIPVRLKLENADDSSISVEAEVMITTANAWETVTVDFSSQVGGTPVLDLAQTYNKVSVFFNFGVDGATAGEKTYHFDDIAFEAGPPVTGYETITFDDVGITYTLTGFGGAEDSSVVADPQDGSNMVARQLRAGGSLVFAGTTVSTGPNDSIPQLPVDMQNTRMTLRVLSPDAAINVRIKAEDSSNSAVSVETEAAITTANAWELLTFDFANPVAGTPAIDFGATYDKISVFFNFGADGATNGEKTYYFDDIAFIGGTGGPGPVDPFSALDFEAGATYALIGFGGSEDAVVEVDPTGGPNLVARIIKNATAELWAGTTIATGANESIPTVPLDATHTRMTARVYSPRAGIPVRLKIELAGDPTISVETEATVTTANTWQTLTFDFANEATGTAALNLASTYNKLSIFFDFGTTGADGGGGTFYCDDIDLAP